MGDKPSVEAKSFHSEVDEQNLYHFTPVSPQDVQTAADIADTSLIDCALCSINDPFKRSDVLVNGVTHCCHSSPSLYGRPMFSPPQMMKQSKSANHSMNGDTAAASCQDGKRSLSVEAKLTNAADNTTADNKGVTSRNCEAANVNHSALTEPASPSTSSTVTVVSVVHADNDGRCQKSGHLNSF